jgi:hypothetical protein
VRAVTLQRLAVAHRHVRDAEESIARQTAAIAILRSRGEDVTTAQRLLRVHIAFLQVARRAVALDEEKPRHEET